MVKQKKEYTQICPRCGATGIIPYAHFGGTNGEWLIDHCSQCGYAGLLPEVEKSQINNFRIEVSKRNRSTDSSFGSRQPSNFEYKLTCAFFLFFGIILLGIGIPFLILSKMAGLVFVCSSVFSFILGFGYYKRYRNRND